MKSLIATFALTLAVLAPAAVHAQQVESSRSISLLFGGISSDAFVSEARNYPHIAARADWRHSPYLLSEVGVSFARPRVELADHSGSVPTFREVSSSVATATVGLQAELPVPHIRPYVGLATGLHMRLDPTGGHRFVSLTQHFPAGVRIEVSDQLGVRAEGRIRFDEQQGNGYAVGGELSAGLTWRR